MNSKALYIVIFCTFLVSCFTKQIKVLPATQFVLQKEAVVQLDQKSLYFQDGERVRFVDINNYEPYCSLDGEFASTNQNLIVFQQGVFTVTEYNEHNTTINGASSSSSQKTGIDYDNAYLLNSEDQPGIIALRCNRWVIGSYHNFLKIEEINQILGSAGKMIQ